MKNKYHLKKKLDFFSIWWLSKVTLNAELLFGFVLPFSCNQCRLLRKINPATAAISKCWLLGLWIASNELQVHKHKPQSPVWQIGKQADRFKPHQGGEQRQVQRGTQVCNTLNLAAALTCVNALITWVWTATSAPACEDAAPCAAAAASPLHNPGGGTQQGLKSLHSD